MVAREAGGQVVVSEVSDYRLKVAQELGFDVTRAQLQFFQVGLSYLFFCWFLTNRIPTLAHRPLWWRKIDVWRVRSSTKS